MGRPSSHKVCAMMVPLLPTSRELCPTLNHRSSAVFHTCFAFASALQSSSPLPPPTQHHRPPSRRPCILYPPTRRKTLVFAPCATLSNTPRPFPSSSSPLYRCFPAVPSQPCLTDLCSCSFFFITGPTRPFSGCLRRPHCPSHLALHLQGLGRSCPVQLRLLLLVGRHQ